MYFHELLIRLRKQRGLSQEQLGAEIGVTRQTVSRWELGETTPEMDKLIRLSDLFGVTLDELTGREAAAGRSGCPSQEPPPFRWHYEYKSRRCLRGLPLVHINLGQGPYRARGILAIGSIARGVVAIGAVSGGILSLGAVSTGLLSLGALSLGVFFSVGGISVGAIALGGLCVGILAAGGCAVGIYAVGGCAIAEKIAVGGYAQAPIAIGERARGALVFLTGEPIPPDAVKAAILDRYPGTWPTLAGLFDALSRL